jgi:hypothetical protein
MPLLSVRHVGGCLLLLTVGVFGILNSHPTTSAEPPADEYAKIIRPMLTKYCHECHAGKQPEADLDLSRFVTQADVRKATKVWVKVGEILDCVQMPPKDAVQPTENERKTLQTWVRSHLKAEAKAHAGDPGRVTLRRLSNAEYTYTLQDLTGVPSLEPAKEFPADGAAGEGFTNSGDALVMSPTLLTKYLDAGKQVAAHAVLLPDGIRFSPHTTRRDWTNELLDRIRTVYGKYADLNTRGARLNLQGEKFDSKEGGGLPVEKYVSATLIEREAIWSGKKALTAVAAERGLSVKYLAAVWAMFTSADSSPLLDDLRAKWKAAKPDEAESLTRLIGAWQNAVWKFNSVGHIGRAGGPKAWLEAVDPLTAKHEVRWKLPPTDASEVTLFLVTSDAGDGSDYDFAVWGQPRFVTPGRSDLLLKDVRALAAERVARRTEAFAATARYLTAVDDAIAAKGKADVPALAKKHAVNPDVLAGWLGVLGVGSNGPVKVTGHLNDELKNAGGHNFVTGWGSHDTPLVLANSSDKLVRIPGDVRGHGVVVHPSPKLNVAVGWQSPVSGTAKVEAKVQHAHVGCGNGVVWAVEVRRGTARERLASGIAHGQKPPNIDPIEKVNVSEGDLISVVVGPRDGNHSCDLTATDLTITIDGKVWDLSKNVTPNIRAGNPHSGLWHFYTEPTMGAVAETIPKDSPLGKWRTATTDRAKQAGEVEKWLAAPPPDQATPDGVLHRRLTALNGPLFGQIKPGTATDARWSVDPQLFGTKGLDANSLGVKAPAVVEVKVPADLVAGTEFVATGTVESQGAVQLRVSSTKPADAAALQPGGPILVGNGPTRERMVAGLTAFRDLFPPAVCYSKIVPIDEVITLHLHYREDHHLARLMLTDAELTHLDRLWDELRYVSQDAFAQVDAFKQLLEYASQDGDPKLFEPLRQPTMVAAEELKKRLTNTEPKHLEAVLEFAGRAYRRPLTKTETDELTALYAKLRKQELPHDQAIRLTLARVLVSSSFLYKLEKPGPDATAVPVSDWELATRLSYFLWASCPDAELRTVAASGKLKDLDVLAAQAKRMLADPKVRRLATEFGCQWLHVRGFDTGNEKSERHFPEFAGLRAAMYEESVLFFTDLFQHDRPLSDLLDSDATYLNESLARFYGIPNVAGEQWRRVDGVKKHGRGGILGLGTTLATQSGASRTSPILRGNWVSEVLLGEKLPRPPKGVPQLPDDEAATDKLTMRQLVERHASDAKCAVCHKKIDAYGFALEGFDPIGRRRDKDLGGRPVDTKAKTADGSEFDGLDGLRTYLLTKRKETFERHFLRKLLGYALGRAVQLSDEPLLDEMQEAVKNGKVSAAVEAIVRSKQFREIRGAKWKEEAD